VKKAITIVCAAALVLSLGVAAYAANSARTSQPETTQGEEIPAEVPRMEEETSADLPEMNSQPPRMDGEKPSGPPDMIDFDAMAEKGVISQETCDRIKAYMEEHKPAGLPEMDGQPPRMDGEAPAGLPEMNGEAPAGLPEMNGQPPRMGGEAPAGLPEMDGEMPAGGGLLDDLLSDGIITQAEYDALKEAIAA